MDLRGLLQFTSGNIESLTFTPAERDPTASLVISANFTPVIADIMNVRAAFYADDDDKPHFGPTRVDLQEKKLRDIELILPMADNEGQWDAFVPEQINGFRVDRDAEDAPVLRLHMRVRIQGRYEELAAFLRATNKDDFEFAIRSRQAEFDWSGTSSGGTKVDMSGDSDKGGKAEANGPLFQQPECVHCDRGVSRNQDGRHMLNGELVECPRPVAPSEFDGSEQNDGRPAVASAAQMGIRKPREPKRRRPTAEEVDENTLGVSVQ